MAKVCRNSDDSLWVVAAFGDAVLFTPAGVGAGRCIGRNRCIFLASITGTHFAFMAEPSLVGFWFLLNDDHALHPRMRSALEMHDASLIELLFKGGAGCQHR